MAVGARRRGRSAPRVTVAAITAVAVGAVGMVTLLAAAAGPSGGAATGGRATPSPQWGAGTSPRPVARPAIPSAMGALYRAGATTCPGLPWQVLAGIGTVESSNGTSALPGVHAGANAAGAEGPMQFEPATFAAYALPVPPGGAAPPSPYDPVDAVYAAARLLCADGARHGADLSAAVFSYDHSEAYVAEVFAVAASLGWP